MLPAEADTSALLEELASANRWRRLSAARRLAWRDDDSLDSRLAESLAASDSHTALEALWLLARRSVLLEKESRIRTALGHTNPQVRAWTIRLLGDDPVALDEAHAVSLAELARTEPNVEVRAQLAATARRLSPKQARPILIELFGRGEDLEDPFLPLLLWWNVERLLTTDLAAELDYWSQSTLWDYPIVQRHISGRLARRLALGGKQRELAGLARLIREAPNAEVRLALRLGFEEAYRDRPLPVLPKELVEALRTAGADSLALRLRQGEEAAIEAAAHRMVSAEKLEERRRYLGLISESGIPAAESILLKATEAGPSSQRAAALRGLASFKSPEVLGAAIAGLQQADTEIREAALGLLALRPEWSKLLINQVDERKIDREIVPPTIRSRIRLHEDDELLGAIDRIWPEDLAQDSTAVVTEVRRLSEIAAAGAGNPYEGRRLFAERCGKCHQLFGTGGEIGPDLTSYQRTDVERILLSILSPSLELREGYEQYLAIDENGRLITGLLVDQDPSTVILRTAEGQTTPLARESLEEFKPLPTSLMPEGLLNEVSPQALRDLIAYLRASQPLP